MTEISDALNAFSTFMWGTPLIVLLVGGGVFFVLHSRGLPYLHFRHSVEIIRRKFDATSGDQGDISHFKALATALSGTLGPVVNTLIVCTCTALAILITGVWQGDAVAVTMTSAAYEQVFPGFGGYLLKEMS